MAVGLLVWATSNGYGFDDAGSAGQGANQPVQTVDWYDVVKWCNARSQQAGLTPVYYTDAGFTRVYTNGETDAVYPNWAASGYRLPTEAEWEKAARGGLSGQRFPWGDMISETNANYYGCISGCGWSYDLGPDGYNAVGGTEESLHESGGLFCGERVWALRHGGECIRVVLGLVWDAIRSTHY